MAKKVIDNVTVLTTPKAMMEAIDDNFDELYAAVTLNTAKVSNVTTNLSVTTSATTMTVVSSDGADAVLPLATSTLSGLLSPAEKTAIAANSAKVSNVTTDIYITTGDSTVTVVSSDGADAVIPTATTGTAGVMSKDMVLKLNAASAAYEAPWI